MAAYGKWTPNKAIAVGDIMEPREERLLRVMFKCTAAGNTGETEPVWDATIGNTNLGDGTVDWETVEANYLEWRPAFIYKSGPTEPVWPTTVGVTVVDPYPIIGGEVTWKTRVPAIIDENCPQHEIAFPMSQKVFSPGRIEDDEDDVVRYCATNAPKDWSTEQDAGFLPTGQHSPTSVAVKAIGEYRGRMVIWTESDQQVWTTDPDPAEMALFDSVTGVGTTFQNGHAGVAGDLFFTTLLGVRTLSVAAGSTNLQAGDVGTGIDELVRESISDSDADHRPVATYYPGNGQFWLAFAVPGEELTNVYVYSMPELGKRGSWSRYELPFCVECFAQLGGKLYVRSKSPSTPALYLVDENAIGDEVSSGFTVYFAGVVEWPYLELGNPASTKMLHSIDISGIGSAEVQIGYDPVTPAAITAAYTVGADTTYGTRVPFGLSAPQMSFRITYPADNETKWQLNSFDAIVDDMETGV